MFNSHQDQSEERQNTSSGSNSTDSDDVDSASPIYSPRTLAEAHLSPRGLHNVAVDGSNEQLIESPRSTPQIRQRTAVGTPPSGQPLPESTHVEVGTKPTGTPANPKIQSEAALKSTHVGTSEILSVATSSTVDSPSSSIATPDSIDRLPARKSSILKPQPVGEEAKQGGGHSNLKKDSHVQFKKEVRKVDIITDGDHDAEVSESLVDINDNEEEEPYIHLQSNSSLVVNAMLHALAHKLGIHDHDKPKTKHVPGEERNWEDECDIDDVKTPYVDAETPQEGFITGLDQRDSDVTVEPEQPAGPERKEYVSSSMPNMRSRKSIADDMDRSVSIEVIVDDQDIGRDSEERLTSPSGHGFIIKEETTLTELILTILLEIRATIQDANNDIKQVLGDTIQKLDLKRAACKSEANMRVTPDLHKLLRSASSQILKGTEAGDVRQVKQVLSSLLSIASDSSELSGYEADGEDDTEKSSMFVQTSDDMSDDLRQRTLPISPGDTIGLPGDETKSDTFNRVIQWREGLKNTQCKVDSSTDSDLSIISPDAENKVVDDLPKQLSNKLVIRLQEEEKQDLDGFIFPVERRNLEENMPDAEEKEENTEILHSLRTPSILKHRRSVEHLKKDSHVQFKDDVVKVDIITDGSDEAEVATSVVNINDDLEHDKPPSCDEDILSQVAHFLSLSTASIDIYGSSYASVIADAMINAFLKQLQKKSSDDLTFKHNTEESTFENPKEIVHLDLPVEVEIKETEVKEEEAKWKEPVSTSLPDIRPTIINTDLMAKSASIEVIMEDEQFDAFVDSQPKSQIKDELAGVEITNKIISRVQVEEKLPTGAVIHPQVTAHSEKTRTALELYSRIKEVEEIPVPKTSSTSSSNVSERSSGSHSSQKSGRTPSVSSDSSIVSLSQSDHTPTLSASVSSDLSSRISATPPVPTEDILVEQASPDEKEEETNQASSELDSVPSDESMDTALVNWIIQHMSLKDLLKEYNNWKENKKRGFNKRKEFCRGSNACSNIKCKMLGRHSERMHSSSEPCIQSDGKKSVESTRSTKNSSGIANKIACSELFCQLLLIEGIDTECGDGLDRGALTQVLSDSGLSDEYADDERSDTTIESSENLSSSVQKTEGISLRPSSPTVPSFETVIEPEHIASEMARPSSPTVASPPVELNTSLILSSMKKSLEKLDLQLTAGVPFVDLTKLPFTSQNTKEEPQQKVQKQLIDHFPARDRLLQMIGTQPVELNDVETDSNSVLHLNQVCDETTEGKPGERLLQLIRLVGTIDAKTPRDSGANAGKETEAIKEKQEIKETKQKHVEVQSDDAASQTSDESDPDRNKLLKLIRSLDKFGMFLPTALGHPSLTELPPREETEPCLAGDWVVVHIQDVPDVEVIMKESAEDKIDQVIKRLQKEAPQEEDKLLEVTLKESAEQTIDDVIKQLRKEKPQEDDEGPIKLRVKSVPEIKEIIEGKEDGKAVSVIQEIDSVLANLSLERGRERMGKLHTDEEVN